MRWRCKADAPALENSRYRYRYGESLVQRFKGVYYDSADDFATTSHKEAMQGSNIQKTSTYFRHILSTLFGWDGSTCNRYLPSYRSGVDSGVMNVCGRKSSFFSGGVLSLIIYQGTKQLLLWVFMDLQLLPTMGDNIHAIPLQPLVWFKFQTMPVAMSSLFNYLDSWPKLRPWSTFHLLRPSL